MPKIELKDLLTFGNALSGITGISLAIAGQSLAWLYVFPAVLLDFLDGRIARKTRKANEFGKQLDSLADVVSFAVAPTVIAMLGHSSNLLLVAASAFYVCTGLLRLAWFNIQVDEKHYNGLPSPVAAVIVLIVNTFANEFAWLALFVSAVAMVVPVKIKKF